MGTGSVKWFDEKRGYGVILPDEGEKDLIFREAHIQCEPRTLSQGQRVEFECIDARRGSETKWVRPIEE